MTTAAAINALRAITDEIIGAQTELNELDGFAGDGDLGISMASAARAVQAAIAEADEAELQDVLKECSLRVAREAPSTSGTLVATGLLGAAKAVGESTDGSVPVLARVTQGALEAIQTRGKAAPGDKTMLDALAPAADALRVAAAEQVPLPEALERAASAARAGADTTAEMIPRAGRARWLVERSKGRPDAGAVLVARLFEAALRALESATATPG